MGIALTSNEAKAVIENVGKEKVKIDDLTSMIFDPAESIRVNLSKVEKENNSNLLNELEDHLNKFLLKNQEIFIKSQIQKNLTDIIKYFESIDINRSNFVNFSHFEKAILTRVKLPENIRGNNKILCNIYNEFIDNRTGLFNYKELVENITSYEYLKYNKPFNHKDALEIYGANSEMEKGINQMEKDQTKSQSQKP